MGKPAARLAISAFTLYKMHQGCLITANTPSGSISPPAGNPTCPNSMHAEGAHDLREECGRDHQAAAGPGATGHSEQGLSGNGRPERSRGPAAVGGFWIWLGH